MKRMMFLAVVLLLTACGSEGVKIPPGEDAPPITSPTPPPRISLFAAGDIHMGRGVEFRLKQQGLEPDFVFERVRDEIRGADIAFANLEIPATDRTAHLNKGIFLKMPRSYFSAVADCGFDVLNLANNHIMDFYEEGMFDTIELLDEAGIGYIGAGRNLAEARRPHIIERNGMKIAFLGYTEMADVVYSGNPSRSFAAREDRSGVAPISYEAIEEDVTSLSGSADMIILSLHWGEEYLYDTKPYQIEFAHRVLDNLPVAAIIGAHPHRMKGVEVYKGKPIFYSLGNFISDQNDPENQEGFYAVLTIEENRVSGAEMFPFKIEGKKQIVPATGEDALRLLANQKMISEKLGDTKCTIEGEKLVLEMTNDDLRGTDE